MYDSANTRSLGEMVDAADSKSVNYQFESDREYRLSPRSGIGKHAWLRIKSLAVQVRPRIPLRPLGEMVDTAALKAVSSRSISSSLIAGSLQRTGKPFVRTLVFGSYSLVVE